MERRILGIDPFRLFNVFLFILSLVPDQQQTAVENDDVLAHGSASGSPCVLCWMFDEKSS